MQYCMKFFSLADKEYAQMTLKLYNYAGQSHFKLLCVPNMTYISFFLILRIVLWLLIQLVYMEIAFIKVDIWLEGIFLLTMERQ